MLTSTRRRGRTSTRAKMCNIRKRAGETCSREKGEQTFIAATAGSLVRFLPSAYAASLRPLHCSSLKHQPERVVDCCQSPKVNLVFPPPTNQPHQHCCSASRRVPFVSCRTPARSVRPKVPSLANMDLNSSEDEDEPLPVTRVTEGVRVARTTRTGSTHITSDLVALPNPRPRSECSSRLSSVRKWE